MPQEGKRAFIRLASFEDYDQIAALEARHGLTVKSQRQWLDLWMDNPAYRELGDWPIGWVVEDGEGGIVGSLGNVPTFSHLDDAKYVVAAGRGWAVDVQHRAFSVMLLARQLKQDRADMNVVTTPSPITAALCTQLGWSRVPVGDWDRSEFWVTNYAKAVQSYLDAKTWKFISSLVGTIVAPPLLLKDAISRRSHSFKSDCQLDWCTTFDERFDVFWEDLREGNPGLLLGTRTSETLRWHFRHALQQGRTWILTARTGSKLIGYAIFERRDIRSLDLTRVLFVDLQTLSKEPGLCEAIVQFALERCRREGIHVLENVGCWVEKLQPVQPAPYRRNIDAWCYLYRITNQKPERSLRQAAAWYPTQYDGDASL